MEIDGARSYPVKDKELVTAQQAKYLLKIERNRVNASHAFATGEYTPFKGFDSGKFGNSFTTVLEFDRDSRQEIDERVIGPLVELSRKHNIPAVFAGREDQPSHVTLEPGVFKDMSEEDKGVVSEYLTSNKSHLALVAKVLNGLRYHFDTLVIAPASFICASQFNDEQGAPYRARHLIEKIMLDSLTSAARPLGRPLSGTLMPESFDDIFHSTISRLTGMAGADSLARYAEEAYATIGEDLRKKPIIARVDGVSAEIATHRVSRTAPGLLLP
jgi:hypothetical protein